MIGQRIKRARAAASLSLRDLAEKAGVSAMAISKYEREQITPSSEALIALAGALQVRVDYFFRSSEIHLSQVEFRKRTKLSGIDQNRIIADVEDQLERWEALDDIFPPSPDWAFRMPHKVPEKIDSGDDIEAAAIAVREDWGLGTNPIPGLIDTFEEQGIRVITTKFSGNEQFDGLSARAGSHHVIAIGEEWPGDRQRFTLAHELGHLILEGRLDESLGNRDIEKACDRFAGAFLAPAVMVYELLGKKRRWLDPRELYLLKHDFGLSMLAWSYRARDLGILDKTTHGKYYSYFRKQGWHKKEPNHQYPSERSGLFEIRIYHALAEDWLGESKAAELLSMPLAELRNWEVDSVSAPDQ